MLSGMRGILLAGGTGSRLSPLTKVVSKQLLPVYDQPLIFHSLSTLMLAGVEEILLIADPNFKELFEKLLGDGSELGIQIRFAVQDMPNGIADALIVGEQFIGAENVALILGDNIFHGPGLGSSLRVSQANLGARIFASRVSNPSEYGVVEFDANGRVISLEEKPAQPRSSYAVPGLYFYDSQVIEIAKTLRPSARGELEITDVNKVYMERNQLSVEVRPRGPAWIDAGTFDGLADATDYVRSIEKRQGQKIGCPYEVAWRLGLIDDSQLAKLSEPLMKSGYGQYLLALLEQGK